MSGEISDQSCRNFMSHLDTFRAVHAPGMVILDRSAVTAMALLFEKVYLPSNIEAVRAFAQKYRIKALDNEELPEISIKGVGCDDDPLANLRPEQKATALRYLDWSARFALNHASLFGEVFETNAFKNSQPLKVKLVKKGKNGQLNTYSVRPGPMLFTEGDSELFPKLLSDGYVPVVSHIRNGSPSPSALDRPTTKQIAALLAMKSVEMLFPRTKAAHPGLILEAREKLHDQLPQFWGAMFKLTTQLKNLHDSSPNDPKLSQAAEDLVDATVRPALLDLRRKLELERKQWFYKILSPIQKGLRIMIGNPPVTQQQLITNALVLAGDVATHASNQLRTIESLKNEAGLTYLLELDKMTNRKSH